MSIKKKVIFAAMAVLGLISIGSFLADQPRSDLNAYSGVGFMLFMLMGVGLEAIVLLIAGLVSYFRKGDADTVLTSTGEVPVNKQWGNAFFLAIGLVLIVGSSVCFGGATLVYG